MTEFFIKTDATAAGPFSGVELRELALAGIIRPQSVVSDSRQGPWHVAATSGLFDEKSSPLPHPPGVQLSRYQVRGMPGAFQGPFKLRELIGFASRGMLPADALIQGEIDQEWLEVKRFRVLAACLDGELVLLDKDRNLIHRDEKHEDYSDRHEPIYSPGELTTEAKASDATAFASASSWRTDASDTTPTIEPSKPSSQELLPDDSSSDLATDSRSKFRERMSRWRLPENFSRRIALPAFASAIACFIVLVASYTAYSHWTDQRVRPVQIVGRWLVESPGDENDSARSAIQFHASGSCVFFRPFGASWSGDYRWVDRVVASEGFQSREPLNVTIDVPEPAHSIDEIRPTDGYIKFFGLGKELPNLDGHPVSELFLRVTSDGLQLGYPTTAHWNSHHSKMMAAWVTSRPLQTNRKKDDQVSLETSPEHLITEYGVPDEARRMYSYELRSRTASFEGSTVIRYGKQKMVLTTDGVLKPYEVVPN